MPKQTITFKVEEGARLILARCPVCELSHQNPFLKMQDAFPAIVINTFIFPTGEMKTKPQEVYLCQTHYDHFLPPKGDS